MKKKRYYLVSLLVVLVIIISGCGKKSVEPDKVAQTFMNHYIYQKDTKEFKDTFVDGEMLSKELTLITNTFEESFSDVFDSVVGDLTQPEKEKIAEDLMKTVRKKSTYSYTVKPIDKKHIEVTYEINGFDYADLVEKTLNSVFKELLRDVEISEKVAKHGLILAFDEALEESKRADKQVFITLNFEKNKKQWQLSNNQDKELEAILLAFVSGVKDKEKYDKEMNDMLDRVAKKTSEAMD